jgi:RNA polymerase primary sigma factor
LTREQEQELFARIQQGDEEAKQRLVQANLLFVVSVAKQYTHLGLSFDDLICEGNLGLIKAVERFDPSLDFKFISYAVWWIRQAMLSALIDRARVIRVPTNQMALLDRIFKTARHLEQETGDRTSLGEVASELGISPEKVEDTIALGHWHQSLDTPLYDDDGAACLMDLLDSQAPSPEDQAVGILLHETIEEMLHGLDERTAEIMRLYYGLDGKEPMTLDAIAQRYSLTRERIRQVKEKALARLRHPSRSKPLKEFWDS